MIKEDPPSGELILICGLPYSGKTTWARAQGHPIVSPDSIRLALHGRRFLPLAEELVWATAHVMAGSLFLAGHKTVIVDATHVSAKRRKPWLEFLEKLAFSVTVRLHIIPTLPSVCLSRASAVSDLEIMPIIHGMANDWDLERPAGWGDSE